MSTLERTTAQRSSRLRDPLLLAGAVLVSWTYVGLVDPHESGHYPVCPTRAVLGLYCPLCGGLRAANDLAHGDVAAAVQSNALFVLSLPFVLVAWLRWMRDRARGSARPFVNPSPRQLWIGLAALLVFAVVRNLPAGAALAP